MRIFALVAIALLVMAAGYAAADETPSPHVEIEAPPAVAIDGSATIEITITGAYIEKSIFIVDIEPRAGWTDIDQGYFVFEPAFHDIAVLSETETLTLMFTVHISPSAPEKVFEIPFVFYGKAGECADGCVPFRQELSVTMSVVDPALAGEKEALGDDAFSNESYSTAKMYYQQAQERYIALGNEDKAADMQARGADCDTGTQALALYESATNKCGIGNDQGAIDDFTESRDLYDSIGNDARVSEIGQLIEDCTPEQPENGENGGSTPYAYYAVAVLAVVAIAAFIVIKYK